MRGLPGPETLQTVPEPNCGGWTDWDQMLNANGSSVLGGVSAALRIRTKTTSPELHPTIGRSDDEEGVRDQPLPSQVLLASARGARDLILNRVSGLHPTAKNALPPPPRLLRNLC